MRFSLLIASLIWMSAGSARAGLVILIQEVGNDVVITANGTLNVADLTAQGSVSVFNGMIPRSGYLTFRKDNLSANLYAGISGPASFGTGDFSFASSSSVNFSFLLTGIGSQIALDKQYDFGAGDTISNSATYSNASFDSLGITPGTYIWTWGSGENADSITLTVVPEPSAYAMATGLALALAIPALRRRSAFAQRRPN